eukprot:CAMPEP_0174854338 /NCGR_PEP_ID=MMETSP1114-20130205/30853_1 /TAXON_ID=312471 /ORGANISM="Neobodo designis, Strain CCAP 1951/1" /LENGTH=450 /DNA_ID=CAMNT_0016089023 /DNA_START=32 /DNA_END=1384 /DNA_ORIENTATION=+
MTGTAATVKYHVSDFLQDRHPYNVEQSYTAQRAREAGRVHNGLMPQGLDTLLESLADDEVNAVQKAVALRHIHAHSAAAEKKIVLLRKGIVPSLAKLLSGAPSHLIEQLAMQIFRSLCVLPQGAHCVIAEGGLACVIRCLSDRSDTEEREEGRTSAASAVSLIAGSWASRAWVLGMACPPDMELDKYSVPTRTEAEAAQLSQSLCDVLVSCVEKDAGSPHIVAHALSAISQLSLERTGLQQCLIAGALRATAGALERFSREDVWVYSESTVETETVLHGATAVWHLALDDVGKRDAAELPFVQHLGRLIAFVLPVKDKLLALKAALAGAACALTMHPPLKQEAIAPLTNLGGEPASLMDLVLRLLQQANDTYEPIYQAQKHGRPNPTPGVKLENAAAVVKNCIQAVRLIVELPAARDVLLDQLRGDDTYTLRRQLFYQTPFQEAFGVRPV